jgi:hypothetical protein
MTVSSSTNDMPNAVASTTPSIITRREVVSAPTSIIQVERISISEAHEAAIAAALRVGRKSANK